MYFETLLEFIRETKFERLGVFTYSQEEGTRAAKMERQIPEQVKQRAASAPWRSSTRWPRRCPNHSSGREIRCSWKGQASAKELQKANVSSWEHGADPRGGLSGRIRLNGHYLIGPRRSRRPGHRWPGLYARPVCLPGQFARVKIIGHTDYDLIAEPRVIGQQATRINQSPLRPPRVAPELEPHASGVAAA